jgi:cell division protein FtsW
MKPHKPDPLLCGAFIALTVLGLFMVFDASSARGETLAHDPLYFFKKQLISFACGLVAFAFFYFIDHRILRRFALFLFLGGVALMCAVFVPDVGTTLKGATRSIAIGPFTLQPAEFFKLFLIIYLASFFASRQGSVNRFGKSIFPFMCIMAGVATVMIIQRSFGSLMILVGIAGTLYFLAGLKVRYILLLGALAALVVIGAVVIEPYRIDRVKTFLNPDSDPLGTGYQVNQALITIGSGGLTGVGLGNSKQKFTFLPETMGDSIFAIFAEETGFIGTMALLAVMGVIFVRGFAVARTSQQLFSKLLASGITVWLIFQFFLNVAANTRLLPLSGIPLPFFSYGGSSLIATLAACGILLNISRQTVKRRTT